MESTLSLTASQWALCFRFLLYGMGMMMVYDGLRIFRLFSHCKRASIHRQDLIYWIVASWILFRRMLILNYGIWRWYLLVSLVLGMVLWNGGISCFVIGFVVKYRHFVDKTGKKLASMWTKPLKITKG